MTGRDRPWIAQRRGANGLGLLGIGLLLLALPLCMLRGVDHPLASALTVNLCGLLPTWPAPGLVAKPVTIPVTGGTGACDFIDDRGRVAVSSVLTSTHTLSSQGAQRTNKAFDVWRKEVAASGAIDLKDLDGTWDHGISYRLGASQQVLIEDRGVLLSLQSNSLDAASLEAYAGRAATALRAAK